MRRLLLVCLAFALLPAAANALDEMQDEETIAELLATPPPPPEESAKAVSQRQWGILPEFGYGPETGPKGGLKFQHRNIGGLGADFDVHGSYALNQQQNFTLTIGTPHLMDDRFLALFRVHYDFDPQFDFFSLGNNHFGPDPVSTHAFQNANGAFTAGWRPWAQLALNVSIGLRDVHISRGDRDDHRPFTVDAFPHMPGIPGGMTNPITASIVWTTREDVVRPTEGWRVIALVSHTNKVMLSDFQYTRAVADVSYLFPIWKDRHILGVRAAGGYVDGPFRSVPFWELEELGGDDTLRGFFPHRFLGGSRMLGTVEYRAKLFAFNFFSVWRVTVDGAVFGEAGRVFISRSDMINEFGLTEDQARQASGLEFSYGPGLRFALSRALIARIDAGFSNESHGLAYVTFGHTF